MIGQFGQFIKELERRMSNKNTSGFEKRRFVIIKNIQICKENKEKIAKTILALKSQYKQGSIDYNEYELRLARILKNRTPEQWISYYDKLIEQYNKQLAEISRKEKLSKTAQLIIPFVILAAIFVILLYTTPQMPGPTGLVVSDIGLNVRNWEGKLGLGYGFNNNVSCSERNNYTVKLSNFFKNPAGLKAPATPGNYNLTINISYSATGEHVAPFFYSPFKVQGGP